MPKTQRLRKWHFLLLGGALILESAYLWYWEWRILGLPKPIQPEHFIVIVSFIFGFFVLGLFIFRLSRKQAAIMLVCMIIANLLVVSGSLWIFRNYTVVFDWFRPAELADVSAGYISNWKESFLTPPLYALIAGLLLLWAENLVVFLVRKPSDNPE